MLHRITIALEIQPPIGLEALEDAELVEMIEDFECGEPLLDLVAILLDFLEMASHLRRVRLVVEHFSNQRRGLAGGGLQGGDVAPHRGDSVADPRQELGVQRAVGQRQRGDRPRGIPIKRLGQRHRLGVLFGDAAFGGVDDLNALLFITGEVALELVQIRLHLCVGVDRLAVYVAAFVQDESMAGDALPFHHLDRVERVQLGGPHLVDGGTGRVVQRVGECEILADQNDGIAAEKPRHVHRQMRHRRPLRKCPHRPLQVAQQFVEEL